MDTYVGIFDSGVGGLTVAKALRESLPDEQIIYLGDTARVPYGSRDAATIRAYAYEMLNYIERYPLKLLIVACNTITAVCYKEISRRSPVPVIGVVEPTVVKAALISKNSNIGVIGTRATIESHVYKKIFHEKYPRIVVTEVATPLFVPIVEEGLIDHIATSEITRTYLAPFLDTNIDTLILGCTHYPMLYDVIKQSMGSAVTIVDSAHPTANTARLYLTETHTLSKQKTKKDIFMFTELSEKTRTIVSLFLGIQQAGDIEVKKIDLTDKD